MSNGCIQTNTNAKRYIHSTHRLTKPGTEREDDRQTDKFPQPSTVQAWGEIVPWPQHFAPRAGLQGWFGAGGRGGGFYWGGIEGWYR